MKDFKTLFKYVWAFFTFCVKFTLWSVALAYFVVVTLTHIPDVQIRLGQKASEILSKELGTRCNIGKVRLGYLNRVIIDDVMLSDQQGKAMLTATRVAVTPEFSELLKGNIVLSSVQLFGANAMIYKDAPDAPLNIQFVIDKLSNPEKEGPSDFKLSISSVILRNISASYDLNYKPRTDDFLDINHIKITNLRANISDLEVDGSNVTLQLRNFAVQEHGGLKILRAACNPEFRDGVLTVDALELKLPDGEIFSHQLLFDTNNQHCQADMAGDWKEIDFDLSFESTRNSIDVKNINLYNRRRTLTINGNGKLNVADPTLPIWEANITELYADMGDVQNYLDEYPVLSKLVGTQVPEVLARMGFVKFSGKGQGQERYGQLEGVLETRLGNMDLSINNTKEMLSTKLGTEMFYLGTLLENPLVGDLAASIDAEIPQAVIARICDGTLLKQIETTTSAKTKEEILNSTNALKQTLEGIAIKTDIVQADYDQLKLRNAMLDILLKNGRLLADIQTGENNLALIDASADLDISRLAESRLLGSLDLRKLRYQSVALDNIKADFLDNGLDITAEMAQLHIVGDYMNRNFDSEIKIASLHKLNQLLNLGLDADGAIDAKIRMRQDSIAGVVKSGMLDIGGKQIYNLGAVFDTDSKKINSSLTVDFNPSRTLHAELNSVVSLFDNEHGGKDIEMDILPSKVYVADSLFDITESHIKYHDDVLDIRDMQISHGTQSVTVNGRADKSDNDSIVITLNNLDVPYILNWVDFHSVRFTGQATGRAVVKNLFGVPDAKAHVIVEDFTFENGRMGVLYANAAWNTELGQVDIEAYCDDCKQERRLTYVKGYVSPTKNFIDLGITAQNTRGEFVGEFCKSFLSNVDVSVNGKCRVWGDLRTVSLTGDLNVSGGVHVKSLGVDYKIENQPLDLQVNEINFNNFQVRDKYGNLGLINGQLHHQYLSRLTFDLNVKPQKLLCYDFPDYGNDVFFGKAFATGSCQITGRSGRITFDIDAKPDKGSFIEYNAANPDAITEQQFITWRNKSALSGKKQEEEEALSDFKSDIFLNMNIHATPDATLRVLMDANTGDKIVLQGTGDLRATYYNKGRLAIFGNYLVNTGQYSMTIQNLLRKDFTFQQGSQIVFGGEPFDAQLSLKAVYPVNGVPLSDLEIGNSFKNNNVRVDCIMDITGTAEKPLVDFDFDMPTVSSDANSMVHSLINSEQEKNQQVIYLLAIGRFYSPATNSTDNAERQSQASLAMQSFLSGTVSQQINNLLGSVTKKYNWNLGANISPGDEGLNNAEYEGLLSGSLFDNRLLINGQFGYRDNPNATSSFIGDFDIRYLLLPNGNAAIRVYNQTNDRYFTRSSLNTQGIGLLLKYDFRRLLRNTRPVTINKEK